MAYISIGDRLQDIERLVGALADIKRLYREPKKNVFLAEYIAPVVVTTPQQAFYAEKESLPIEETAGRVCGEFVMCYPPGIPILAPGEQITEKLIHYIRFAQDKGCSMQGPESLDLSRLNVLKEDG